MAAAPILQHSCSDLGSNVLRSNKNRYTIGTGVAATHHFGQQQWHHYNTCPNFGAVLTVITGISNLSQKCKCTFTNSIRYFPRETRVRRH
ncbi:unnamed protein product [Allacma fusca]|uniref:Uncharacterized protein n=1 Tax=Allacma fusca TaxID=39272 RepID=A0A8J2LJV0_9HEXA|nr:unnamed protein product [Allacma fusca]